MSLVGFSAKNHPQQPVRDDVDDRRPRPTSSPSAPRLPVLNPSGRQT